MTPSLLVLYTDKADARMSAEFDQMVIATRLGNADQKSYNRWRRARQARVGKAVRGLTGAALEQAVGRVAALFPENVIRGVA